MSKLYGIFSRKQAEVNGIIYIYRKPDGTNIECTEISPKQGSPNTAFDDKIDLGEVIKYIGKHTFRKKGIFDERNNSF